MSDAAALPAGRAATRARFRRPSAIPGFRLTFGITLTYLTLLVLLPLAVLLLRAASVGPAGLWALVTDARNLAALKTSFGLSLAAAAIDAVFGLLIAWVLTRYRFPGRRIIDALVDLPFALPTAVAGIALASLYAPNGWLGEPLMALGIKVAYTPLGILVALVFVGLPFCVRTVQPLVAEIDRSSEEAAAILGASRLRALVTVILPPLIPAMLTGFALAFARAVGEYGSVIFVAGNLPYVSEIAPLLIVIKLEEFNYAGATAIAAVMLLMSFAALLAINLVQDFSRRRFGHV